jgi:hypothetical protein
LLALLVAQGGNRHSSRPHLAARFLDPPIGGESVGDLRTYLNLMTAFISPSTRVAAARRPAGVGPADMTSRLVDGSTNSVAF